MEFVGIAVGLFLCFLLKGTDPICRMQDICHDGCINEYNATFCNGTKDLEAGDMLTYRYPQGNTTETWRTCNGKAIEWKEKGKPDELLSKMICYIPKNMHDIKCVIPLEGKACDNEREYVSFFHGAASAASAASSLIIPRILEMIFLIIFTICCVQIYTTSSRKKVVGISLGTVFIIFFILAIYFAATNSTRKFAMYRVLFWVVGWFISAILFEPILILIQYYLFRCEFENSTTPEEKN